MNLDATHGVGPTGRADSRRPVLRWRRGSVWALAASFAVAPVLGLAALQAPADPSPATGDARVVAQGVAQVDDGDLVWQVTAGGAETPGNAQPVASELGFLVASDGAVLVETTGSDDQVRLAAGEATMTRPGGEQLRAALGPTAATYFALELLPSGETSPVGEPSFTSEPFAGPGDRHDIDLVGAVLDADESIAIPAGAAPTLVLVTQGSAQVANEAGEAIPLGAGEAYSAQGGLTVSGLDAGAQVVAAVVGPAVPRLAGGAAASTPGAGGIATIAAAAGEDNGRERRNNRRATAEATTTAGQAAGEDSDGDGLTDAEEDALNTDPLTADTDADGLSDGDEVNIHNTLPLIKDSDGDGVTDGDEIAAGTDPLDPASVPGAEAATEPTPVPVEPTPPAEEPAPLAEEPAPPVEEPAPPAEEAPPAPAAGGADTDGDGIPDELEYQLGTDPFVADSDGDGLSDGDEYNVAATGILNPDSDGDGVLDGDEINNGTNPNDPTSF